MYRGIRFIIFSLAATLCVGQISGCGLFRQAVEQSKEESVPFIETDPLRYTTSIQVQADDEESASIRSAMEKHSQLILMKDDLPDGVLGLTRRARTDQAAAVKLLNSLGYYDGKAQIEIVPPAEQEPEAKAEAILTLVPGPRYHVGAISLRYSPAPTLLPPFDGKENAPLPETLSGLTVGAPAVADDILAAVGAVPPVLHRSGYPEANVASTRYTLNKAEKTLNAEVVIDPGKAALMGDAEIRGTVDVEPEYLKELVTWKKGEPWDERRIASYREELQKLGLFRAVDVKAAPMAQAQPSESAEEVVELPALVDVRETYFRTVSASARYATDIGIGVQGEWQHRNLFGEGEKLTLKAPFAQDKRGLQADFEKPSFGHKDQKLLAGASYIKEETDAYDSKALSGYVGLERILSPDWRASVKLFGEQGTVTKEAKEDYHYGSVMLGLRRDTRDSILEPTRGTYLSMEAAPLAGYYSGNFTALSSKLEFSAYCKPFGSEALVLAGRMVAGATLGAELYNIPPSLRFYAGGGGSVRGYAYQAIGPRDSDGDPLGGRSLHTLSLEARFRVAESIGIVPFLDGGMIYDDETPRFFSDFQWSAGLGLRYYTPIGPIRFDVAVPLDKKTDDKSYQIYISIGQAF